MINYITFTDNGLRDLKALKDAELNIIDIKDNDFALKLVSYLDVDIFIRVKGIKKDLFGYTLERDCFSGYLNIKHKAKKGTVITASEKVYENIPINRVEISKDLFMEDGHIISNKVSSDRLTNAKLVFLVGRGIGSKENYLRLKEIAKKLNAEVGCTRPVCMNGYESYENFVGISGKSLNADLCVTFGVSGSGPLIKGIENVKKLISINNDKEALILNYSDYKIIEDVEKVIKELESELK